MLLKFIVGNLFHDQLGLDPAAIGGEVEIIFLTESESSHSGG